MSAPLSLDAIKAAREQSYLLWIEAYCEGHCPVREFKIHIKDHDDQFVDLVTKHGIRCPVCGRKAVSVFAIDTPAQHAAKYERNARGSVTRQMYERDHRQPGKLTVTPLRIYLDDTLPPTPEGWWDGLGQRVAARNRSMLQAQKGGPR